MAADDVGTPPSKALDDNAFDVLFREARSYNSWQPRPLPDGLVRQLFELTKWGPTAGNTNPARYVFVRSPEAKERLKPHLYETNVEKMLTSPCCVIIAYDSRFYELMGQLFPSRDMGSIFSGNPELAEETAKRNSSLQGAYLMMGARALGLDCGPMSGFNPATLDAEFFPDGRWKSNFLCILGYGGQERLFPRNPRLEFDQACLDI